MNYNHLFFTFKDVSESVFNNLQPRHPASSKVIVIDFDDFTMRTKLLVRDGIIAIRFDEKSFLSNILGFNDGWE